MAENDLIKKYFEDEYGVRIQPVIDPDFIIVREDKCLGYVIDILEPHSVNFKDNL